MPMHIVYLTNQFPPNVWGGLGMFVDFLAEALGQDNKVWVYTTNSGRLDDVEDRGNVKIYRPIRSLLRKLLQRKRSKGYHTLFFKIIKIVDLFFNNIDCFLLLRRNLARDRYDVIVVHDFMHSLTGILCKLFLRTPIVFHVHATEYSMTAEGRRKDALGVIRFFERRLADISENIIVGTEEMRALMAQHGWDQRKIEIVPLCNVNGAYETFETASPARLARVAAIRRDLAITDDQKVIVYAGRLVFLKGFFTLLHAMPTIIKARGDVRLVVVGEGHQRTLTRLVQQLGLDDRVHFYHRFLSHEDVLCHYLLADLCIFPSIQEPFGLVALEAMSLGRPVILGDGFSRVFEGGRDAPNVLYADARSPEELAAKALALLDDPAAAAAMGRRARRYVQQHFQQQRVVELTLAAYRRAICCTDVDQIDSPELERAV